MNSPRLIVDCTYLSDLNLVALFVHSDRLEAFDEHSLIGLLVETFSDMRAPLRLYFLWISFIRAPIQSTTVGILPLKQVACAIFRLVTPRDSNTTFGVIEGSIIVNRMYCCANEL